MKSDNINSDNFGPDAFDREYARQQAQAQANNNAAPRPRKQTEKTKSQSGPNPIVRFFSDRRTTMFLGIAMLCWATYMIIAAISFFATGADDQSAAINLSVAEMSQNPEAIHNAGGAFGAFLSHNMISNGLGLGVFILIYYFYALGWYLLNRTKFSFWSLTAKTLIDSIAVSVVLGLVTYSTSSWVYWGGIHGHEINRFLISTTGIIGATLVSILLVTLVAAIYLNELRIIYVAYRRKMRERQERIEAERAAKEEERRKMEETLRQSDDLVNDTPRQPEPAPTPRTEPIKVNFPDPFNGETDEPEPEVVPQVNPIPQVKPQTPVNPQPQVTPQPTVVPEVVPATPVAVVEEPEPELNIIETEIEEADDIADKPFDPTAELPHFHFPSIDLLNDVPIRGDIVDENEMEENKARITETLNSYKIAISHIDATVGPTVTLYEIIPAEGIRIAQIKKLEDDIALSLAALGIRIIAPIPGKGTIGIEVPNKEPQMVPIRSVITSKQFQECDYELPMALGSTISKDIFIADLAKVPHLLVAGATGQGKSVGLNTIIASLLYKKHPAELKFVLIDPKTVEFKLYSKLEHHYLAKLPGDGDPIITDPMKVVTTLNSLCQEMEDRFAMFNKAETRDIKEYNKKFVARRLNPEKGHRYLPYIVVIVDEFADLTMVAGKEVERPIARLAQKARAAGIHIILATQRPSTDVITGMIKANFPGRVAFRVMQMVDSRTILDRPGANQLIGKGDMLISLTGEVTRVQCAFISTEEVVNICRAIDDQMGYSEAYPLPEPATDSDGGSGGGMGSVNDFDPLFEEAARFIIESGTASTSSLQRRYQIGYNRAGRIMDQLEAKGVVGPASGAKPRNVLIDSLQLERIVEAAGIN